MKKLLTTLALVTLAASPAFAASKQSRQTINQAASESYAAAEDGAAYVENGNNIYANPSDPTVVISNGIYAGRDPDPNVRAQLRRDPGLPTN